MKRKYFAITISTMLVSGVALAGPGQPASTQGSGSQEVLQDIGGNLKMAPPAPKKMPSQNKNTLAPTTKPADSTSLTQSGGMKGTTSSQNMQQAPQDTQGPSQGMQQMPQDVQGPPQGMQQMPQDAQGPSQGMQQMPQDVQGPPQGMQQMPQDMQGPPQGMQQMPQDMQGPPQGMQQMPQDMQSTTQSMQQSTAQEGK